MASEKVNDVENSAGSSSLPLPNRSLHPNADDIHRDQSSSNIPSSSKRVSLSEDVARPLQSSSASDSIGTASEDEITPCGERSTPSKRVHGGKTEYSHRYDLSEYVIEQLSEYDDVDLVKPWHRKLILIHPFVIAWVFITYAAYYGYRVWCNYQYRVVYGGLAEASWIFICVEGVILCR